MKRQFQYTQQYVTQEKLSELLHWLFLFFFLNSVLFKKLAWGRVLVCPTAKLWASASALGASASSDLHLILLSLLAWCPLIVRTKHAGRQNMAKVFSSFEAPSWWARWGFHNWGDMRYLELGPNRMAFQKHQHHPTFGPQNWALFWFSY